MTFLRMFVAAVLALLGIAAPALVTSAPDVVVVVSPDGSDAAAGTASAPLRTIQKAVDRVRGGGTVELRGGHFHQQVQLVDVHDVTLRPYGTEHAVLGRCRDRTGPRAVGHVTIADSHAVAVSGLDITGLRTNRLGVVPVGVYIHGGDQDVRVVGDHVHDLGNDNTTLGSFDINAHGIAAYGDDPRVPISGLSIRDNEVDHLRLGASETVVVNGNVDGWSIVGNRIHDDDNIGIDAIGYESTLTKALPLHRPRPGP